MQIHINTYGSYLHIKDQMFEIKLPDNRGIHHFAAHKIKSIWLSKGIALSTEAVFLAVKNNIDMIFLEWDGHPIGRIWHSKLGSTTLIRKKQLEASLDNRALKYICDWLVKKLENQIDFLKDLKKHRMEQESLFESNSGKILEFKSKIKNIKAQSLDQIADQLRAWEGNAGKYYFSTLSDILPRQYQFNGRSTRPATDEFNAFLNYAYGILYSRVEKSLLIAGIEPYLGFLHRDDYNHKSMVFDFIEPFRIFAEKPIFHLFSGKKVKKDHTEKIANGVRVTKEGKALIIENFNKYFDDEKVRYKNKNRSRSIIIQYEAHRFANELIDFNNTDTDNENEYLKI